MANDSLFAVFSIAGTKLKYEGTYGDYEAIISSAGMDPCLPIHAASMTFNRPWTVGSKVASTTQAMDVPISMEWQSLSPEMLTALKEGKQVDITVFSINQNAEEESEIGFKAIMAGGKITAMTVIPGNQGSANIVQMIYTYKTIDIFSAEDVPFKFEQQSAGRSG